MNTLIKFFLHRPLLVNLMSLVVLIVGLLSVYLLRKDLYPEVDFDVIMVNTVYPGASPEDVEKLVTISIERELKSVDGIEEMNAISLESGSIIFLKIDPEYNVDDVLLDVRNAADQAQNLPDEVEPPSVNKLNNSNQEFIKVTLTGADHFTLRAEAKRLRDRLERVKGVSKVDFGGDGIEEILISIDPKKLIRYELTANEVVRAIQSRNLSISAGKIETATADISIRTVGEFESEREIADVVVRSNASGQKVRVKDIASIKRQIREDSALQRSDGERAIYVQVRKRKSADILSTTRLVKEVVDDFFKDHTNKQLKFRYTDDFSFYVDRRLSVLIDNGKFGLTLVFFTLLLFLNFRASIFTSLGAPIAFMCAFIIMYNADLSLNLISMFGLILVLGMLVDDSIIVSEHYYQKLEQGLLPLEAAREAAIETVKPVAATIITTMIAFGSLFFMGGIMGKFVWPIPAVVIICLVISWIECFFILPSHLAEFVRLGKGKKGKQRWYDGLKKFYRRILSFSLRNNYKAAVFFILLFFVSLFVQKKYLKFILFPNDDIRFVKVMLKGKVGQPLAQTDAALSLVEKGIIKALRAEELDQVRTMVGVNISHGGNSRRGNHYGTVLVYLTMEHERERSTDEIIHDIDKIVKPLVPGYNVSIERMKGGPPKGMPVDIQITGENLDYILKISKQVLKQLKSKEGVLGPEMDFEEGKKQLLISVNEAEAKRLGLDTRSIAIEVRRALAGDAISEIRGSDEDIDIVVQYDKQSRSHLEVLNDIFILNSQQQRIQLSKVAKFDELPGAFVIRRKDQKRIISITSSLNNKVMTPVQAAEEMRPFLEKLQNKYPDFEYFLAGENEDTQESLFRLLRAGIIAFSCIFLVLVTMFSSIGQSLVIMSAIPLGLIGVVITFFIFDKPFSFMALLGLVGLVGVVVNDSIVLVNFINKYRVSEDNIFKAILEASVSRFRAVILTTFTTVAGLLPIAHASGGDPFLKPMALGFAWGLFFSSGVTLIFVPCAYRIYYDMKPPIFYVFHAISRLFGASRLSFAEYKINLRQRERAKLTRLA